MIKERAKKLKTDVPAVFLALKRKDTPVMAKVFATLTVAYALSPIDFIPVLGYLDDLLILPGLVAITVKLIPSGIFEECRIEAAGLWEGGKPKKWFYAILIALIWLLIIGVIIKVIFL